MNELRGKNLGEAKKGDFFLGRASSDPLFIVGTLNDDFKVVVNLSSTKFDISPIETVQTRRGLLPQNPQMFVDIDNRQPLRLVEEPNGLLGALVMSGESVGLLAQNLRHDSLHFVSLVREQIPDDATDAVAFMDWAICLQDPSGAWNKLYEYGPGKAAAGLERL